MDAIVDIDKAPNIQAIRSYFADIGIKTHDIALEDGRRYVVVPAVNTDVAYKIRGLPLPKRRS